MSVHRIIVAHKSDNERLTKMSLRRHVYIYTHTYILTCLTNSYLHIINALRVCVLMD